MKTQCASRVTGADVCGLFVDGALTRVAREPTEHTMVGTMVSCARGLERPRRH
jgi:hypothetical protein